MSVMAFVLNQTKKRKEKLYVYWLNQMCGRYLPVVMMDRCLKQPGIGFCVFSRLTWLGKMLFYHLARNKIIVHHVHFINNINTNFKLEMSITCKTAPKYKYVK